MTYRFSKGACITLYCTTDSAGYTGEKLGTLISPVCCFLKQFVEKQTRTTYKLIIFLLQLFECTTEFYYYTAKTRIRNKKVCSGTENKISNLIFLYLLKYIP